MLGGGNFLLPAFCWFRLYWDACNDHDATNARDKICDVLPFFSATVFSLWLLCLSFHSRNFWVADIFFFWHQNSAIRFASPFDDRLSAFPVQAISGGTEDERSHLEGQAACIPRSTNFCSLNANISFPPLHSCHLPRRREGSEYSAGRDQSTIATPR
jgi:hypothetical protein